MGIPTSHPLPCAQQRSKHHTDASTITRERLNGDETQDLDTTSLNERRETRGNIRSLNKVLGTKTHPNPENAGEGNLRNKRQQRAAEKGMELLGGDWVTGNLTSVYENIPLIFIAQS